VVSLEQQAADDEVPASRRLEATARRQATSRD
jgi:hypothetical protein